MKYSAADIGRMRDAVRYLTMPPMPLPPLGYPPLVGARVEESRIEQIVETRLLTYMANETTADELEAFVEEHREKARHDAEARYKAEITQSRIQFARPLVQELQIKQRRPRWWRR